MQKLNNMIFEESWKLGIIKNELASETEPLEIEGWRKKHKSEQAKRVRQMINHRICALSTRYSKKDAEKFTYLKKGNDYPGSCYD